MTGSCPWCGCNAIDISTHDNDYDQRTAYICAGIDGHRWREGEGPAPVEPVRKPLIVLARG